MKSSPSQQDAVVETWTADFLVLGQVLYHWAIRPHSAQSRYSLRAPATLAISNSALYFYPYICVFQCLEWRLPRISVRDKILHTAFILCLAVMVTCAVVTVQHLISDSTNGGVHKYRVSVVGLGLFIYVYDETFSHVYNRISDWWLVWQSGRGLVAIT